MTQFSRHIPTFQHNLLPPPSAQKSSLLRRGWKELFLYTVATYLPKYKVPRSRRQNLHGLHRQNSDPTLNTKQVMQCLHTCDFARSSFSFCASPSLCLRPNSSLCWSCSCAKKSARSSIRPRTWAWPLRCFLRSSLPITVSLSTCVESYKNRPR